MRRPYNELFVILRPSLIAVAIMRRELVGIQQSNRLFTIDPMKTSIIAGIVGAIFAVLVSSTQAFDDDAPQPFTDDDRSHWSLLPRSNPDVPQFKDEEFKAWVRNPIDAFILKELNAAGLKPSKPADQSVLVRRLHFQLLGLPPSALELQCFMTDPSPTAWSNAVDRLLADPRYGERWAQHWLDVVRFSETEGFEYDRHRPGAWMYRDYVIRSLNGDKPYDQFVIEQLAGDEYAKRPNVNRSNAQKLVANGDLDLWIAVGFNRLGPVRRNAGNPEVAFSRNEVLTEMTDIVGSAILGLTVGCARCHDHMFDPIRQTDYYQLQAFFAATHEYEFPLVTDAEHAEWEQVTKKLKARIDVLREEIANAKSPEEADKFRAEFDSLKAKLPELIPAIFSIRNDESRRDPIHLLKRGDENKRLQPLKSDVLSVLKSDSEPVRTTRLDLAKWLTNSNHPLTARVIVNRIWHYHFGQGLVDTPNDFGINGSSPSHPELLDFLSNYFVESGWSIKAVHRLILNSNTFRQSSIASRSTIEEDPTNRLLSRYERRRLSAEEIRDGMLRVSGALNDQQFGRSIMVPVAPDLVNLLYKPTQWEVSNDVSQFHRRSVYLIAKRNLRLPFLEVFDQPDLQTSCGMRESSTHAPQALELLNGELANQLAVEFANRLATECGSDPNRQIEHAFLVATGRSPTDAEARISKQFLQHNSLREFALAVFNLNAFLYVE